MRLLDREAAQNAQVQESASAAHAAQDTEGQRALPVPSCPGAFPLHGGIHSLGWACRFDGTVPSQLYRKCSAAASSTWSGRRALSRHMCCACVWVHLGLVGYPSLVQLCPITLEVALMILKSVRAMGHRDFCPAARGRKSILDQTWPRHVHHSFPNCLRCLMCSALLSQT